MKNQANQAVVQRFYDEVFTQKKMAVLGELSDPHLVVHDLDFSGVLPGGDLEGTLTAFPDVVATINLWVGASSRPIWRWMACSSFRRSSTSSWDGMRGITTVAVAGLTADVCVGSTARDAFQRDFHVITLSDCTAEKTQAQYEGCMETMKENFGRVMTSDELFARWVREIKVP
jgi:hypothetical protein